MTTTTHRWRDVELGDVCEFKYGKSLPESARAGGNIPVFGSNGEVGRHNEALTTGPTIVIGRKGSFGEVTYSENPCWPIDTTYYVDSSATTTNLRWLAYRLSALGLNRLNRAAAIPGLNREDAYRKRLLLPLLPEQRRIAEILEKADALRAKRRAATAQLDTLTESIFLETFGDPRANPRGWPSVALGSLVSDVRGGASLTPDDFLDSGFPILHKGAIKAVGEVSLDVRKKTFVSPDYARVNRCSVVDRTFVAVTLRDLVPSGPNIGFVADLMKGQFDEYLLAQGAYAFKPDRSKVTPQYLVHLSNNENFRHVLRQNAVGSTQIHIRTPVYLAIKIPLPCLDLQHAFIREVEIVEKLKRTHREALTKLDQLFASIQLDLFHNGMELRSEVDSTKFTLVPDRYV